MPKTHEGKRKWIGNNLKHSAIKKLTSKGYIKLNLKFCKVLLKEMACAIYFQLKKENFFK